MRTIACVVAVVFVLFPSKLDAQGVLSFVTHPRGVDAKVTLLNGLPVSSAFTAELYGGPVGTPLDALTPLKPKTSFRDGSSSLAGYVNGVNVIVPAVQQEQEALLVMRAYDGKTWETSLCRGQSEPFIVRAGGDTGPPGILYSLKGFTVDCNPEPSALSLVAAFAGIIGLCQLSRGQNCGKSFRSG